MPERIQRSRKKGWRMPEGAIYVGRPSRWGNPFPWKGGWITWSAVAAGFRADLPGRRAASLFFYRGWLGLQADHGTDIPLSADVLLLSNGSEVSTSDWCRMLAARFANSLYGEEIKVPAAPNHEEIKEALRGRDLCCWCPPGPCHADVLLEIANTLEPRP